jgi:hypothetical protein
MVAVQGSLIQGTDDPSKNVQEYLVWGQFITASLAMQDRCVPERKFLDVAPRVRFVPWTNHP